MDMEFIGGAVEETEPNKPIPGVVAVSVEEPKREVDVVEVVLGKVDDGGAEDDVDDPNSPPVVDVLFGVVGKKLD